MKQYSSTIHNETCPSTRIEKNTSDRVNDKQLQFHTYVSDNVDINGKRYHVMTKQTIAHI
jgi:hypothetical protein